MTFIITMNPSSPPDKRVDTPDGVAEPVAPGLARRPSVASSDGGQGPYPNRRGSIVQLSQQVASMTGGTEPLPAALLAPLSHAPHHKLIGRVFRFYARLGSAKTGSNFDGVCVGGGGFFTCGLCSHVPSS